MKVPIHRHRGIFAVAAVAVSAAVYPQVAFGDDDVVDRRELLEQMVKRSLKTEEPKAPNVIGDALLPGASAVDRRAAIKLRRGRYDLKFEKTPLLAVLDTFRQLSGLTFVISPGAEKALKRNEPRLTLELQRLRLSTYLDLIARRFDDYRFVIRHGAVHLILESEYRPVKILRVYYVGDLVRRPPDFRAPKLGLGL